MKPIYYIPLIVLVFLFSSCEKRQFVSEDEIPQWLKEAIEVAETEIEESDPKMMVNHGAWIRYEFEKDYYFQYENMLSSVMYQIYNFEGVGIDSLNILYNTFNEERCCKKYVWKAPDYIDITQ